MRAAAEKKNECKATTCDAASLFVFLASLLPRRAFSPSPSGCSALTGGFSRVMTATPPSISRVAVGGAAMLEKTKRRARKKKRWKWQQFPRLFLTRSPAHPPPSLPPSLVPRFPKRPPRKIHLSPRAAPVFSRMHERRGRLCPSARVGGAVPGRAGAWEAPRARLSRFLSGTRPPSRAWKKKKERRRKGGKKEGKRRTRALSPFPFEFVHDAHGSLRY